MKYIYKIKDKNIQIIDGDRGKNYPKENELSIEGEVLFLSNKNIINNKLSLIDSKYISKEKDSMLGNGKVSLNDIILTTRGTVGNVIIIKNNEPTRINSGMVIIRQETYNPLFLYYYLTSKHFKNQVKFLQSGAAQPQLPIKDLQHIYLPETDICTQQHIVDTISYKQLLL